MTLPDCVLDLGMSEQNLDRTKIPSGFVEHRCLCASERVRAVIFTAQPNRSDPLIDQSGVLAGAEVIGMIDPTGKAKSSMVPPLRSSHASKLAPDVRLDLELYRATGFLLDDHGARSDLLARDKGSDLDLNKLAAS
jgi:hypothetical protein